MFEMYIDTSKIREEYTEKMRKLLVDEMGLNVEPYIGASLFDITSNIKMTSYGDDLPMFLVRYQGSGYYFYYNRLTDVRYEAIEKLSPILFESLDKIHSVEGDLEQIYLEYEVKKKEYIEKRKKEIFESFEYKKITEILSKIPNVDLKMDELKFGIYLSDCDELLCSYWHNASGPRFYKVKPVKTDYFYERDKEINKAITKIQKKINEIINIFDGKVES